jgi:hypothetical protein
MQEIEGEFSDIENDIKYGIEIKFDFDIVGTVEFKRSDDVNIIISSELMERFLSAYLRGRKIESLKLQDIGYKGTN